MAEEVVLRIETPGGPGESETDVQENEHEVQEVETEAWQSALSDVTAQLSALATQVSQGQQASAEASRLMETQAGMIRDLLAANQTANAELLQTVRTLLTPPQSVVVEETPIETPPAVVPAEVGPSVVETVPRRYKAI